MKTNIFFKKTSIFCVTIMLTGYLWASSIWAAGVTQDINARVNIVSSTITLVNGQDLNFGDIAPKPGETVEVLIDASGGAATTSTVTGTASVSGTVQSGLVKVTSPITADLTLGYSIKDADGDADKLQQVGGTTNLDLTAGDIEVYSTSSPLSVTAGTEAEIHIGGLLSIPSTLVDADYGKRYTGVITVTVDYQ